MNEVIALMRERLNYDAETGVLTYSKQAKGNKREGDKVGCIDRHGYIKVMFQRKMYFAHRIAWMVHYGSEPPELIDHINRDKQDNRIANLRACTKPQNSANTTASLSKNGLRGTVRLKNGRFRAQIKHEGHIHYLGEHDTRDAAHTAYQQASIRLYGEFSPYVRPLAAKEGAQQRRKEHHDNRPNRSPTNPRPAA